MSRTVSRRAAAPSSAPGVTRLGDPEINFYLLDTATASCWSTAGCAGISRSYSHTWKAPVAR